MFKRVFKIGSRSSPLALRQVEEVLNSLKRFYPDMKAEIISIDTYGDKDRLTPISDIEGTDFFTREIDAALLRNEIDFAVHSAKDLPDRIPDRLSIAAITEAIDPHDALVSKGNQTIRELPYGGRIGTSSLRRKNQLKQFRNDFQIVDIRGNIDQRLALLDHADGRLGLEAIVVAACALLRLGLEDRIAERIPFEILKPHPLQGSLAVVAREEDLDLIKKLSKINGKIPVTV